MADRDSKAGNPIGQTGCATVHKSTLLQIQTPAHPEQIQVFTLGSLIFDNVADMLKCSRLIFYVASGTTHNSGQKCRIRDLIVPLHLCGAVNTPCGGAKQCTQGVIHFWMVNRCLWPSL